MEFWLTPIDGESTDCESCGYSSDDGYVYYDTVSREWCFEGIWGCYGGESFAGTREELIEWLDTYFREQWKHLFTEDSINRAIEFVKEAA